MKTVGMMEMRTGCNSADSLMEMVLRRRIVMMIRGVLNRDQHYDELGSK